MAHRGTVPGGSRPREHVLRDHPLRDHMLREHMLRDHGRSGGETDGLPLEDLHRFEHVEQAMGLNGLHHRHETRHPH